MAPTQGQIPTPTVVTLRYGLSARVELRYVAVGRGFLRVLVPRWRIHYLQAIEGVIWDGAEAVRGDRGEGRRKESRHMRARLRVVS